MAMLVHLVENVSIGFMMVMLIRIMNAIGVKSPIEYSIHSAGIVILMALW